MKSLNLYIFVFIALVKTIASASFKCEDVYINKKTLFKATEPVKIEKEIKHSLGTEYVTWYIDPCRELNSKKTPEEAKNDKERCPKKSKVCLVKSIEFDGDKNNRRVLDTKGYAIGEPPQDPVIRGGSYILNFEGEDSNTTTEIIFSCAGEEAKEPEIDFDEEKKKVVITYKGMCIEEGKTSPTDDDDKNDDEKKSGGGHFFIRFIFIIIICYFVIGMCYNFFVMHQTGIDIIPNAPLWINLFSSIYDKIAELISRRRYEPLLS